MKKILLLAVCILPLLLFANGDYKQNISPEKILLVFKPGTTAQQKQEIIKGCSFAGEFSHLPTPAVSICLVSDREKAEAYFLSSSQVSFVSFFITDGNENEAGVLDEFFVKLRDNSFLPQMQNKLNRIGLYSIKKDEYMANRYVVKTDKATLYNTVELAEMFNKEAWCEYAAPNYLLFPKVCSSDPLYGRQWAIANTGTAIQGSGLADADMDVDSAWTVTTGSPTIKVAIIDSGVDTLHSDLMANLLPGKDAVGDSTDGYPSPNYDEDGHGTCCAGIVASVKDNNMGTAGVAPNCKIIPVRSFFYATIPGNSTVIPISTGGIFATAISWSWQVGGADILSNSWGLPQSFIDILPMGITPVNDAIYDAAANARNGKGIAMFFSSGNDNDSTGSLWPGKLTECIAVNATSMCDERKHPTDCSVEGWWGGNWGGEIDFSAPGVWVPATDMIGANGFSPNSDYYNTFNGTSAACPNAAAVGALILSIRPELMAEEVRHIIAVSCDKVTYTYDSIRPYGPWCRELGYGRVNAYRAVQTAQTFVQTSINASTSNNELKIYPNPASGYVNIEISEEAVCNMYDYTGALVKVNALHKGANRIDTNGMTKGIYVIVVKQGALTTYNKLFIAR
jgi:subtilisin family serine protease